MSDDQTTGGTGEGEGNVNHLTKDKQLKIGVAIVAVILIVMYLLISMGSSGKPSRSDIDSESLSDTVTRNPSDRDSFAVISKQVNELYEDMGKFKDTNERMNAYLNENEDGSRLDEIVRILGGIESTNEDLTARLEEIERNGIRTASRDPFDMDKQLPGSRDRTVDGSGAYPARPANADNIFKPRGRTGQGAGAPKPVSQPVPTSRRQNVIALYKPSEGETLADEKEAKLKGFQTKAEKPEVYDTADYIPPNAYVSARLVVSVDAPIGQNQTADPKAAQFVITSPARHVQDKGQIEETELEGCLVNGSAQGNLSSERVHIKLHAMTCPLGDGKVSVSKVEGYATHLGKNGIRGTVVSREGDLVTKVILAGALEGLGRTASRSGEGIGLSTTGGGLLGDRPSADEIAIGSLGSGLSAGANTYSEYLLERARAYEPVVSLPTGIEVELVFLSGTLVRPIDEGEQP